MADNGLEMYVRRCLERGDVSWFPAPVTHNTAHGENSGVVAQNTISQQQQNNGYLHGPHGNLDGESRKEAILEDTVMQSLTAIEKQINSLTESSSVSGKKTSETATSLSVVVKHQDSQLRNKPKGSNSISLDEGEKINTTVSSSANLPSGTSGKLEIVIR